MENETPYGIHRRPRNKGEGPPATDWPPQAASVLGIGHRAFAAIPSGPGESPASSRSWCPLVPPGTALRRGGKHPPPSQARTSSRSTSLPEPQDGHSSDRADD